MDSESHQHDDIISYISNDNPIEAIKLIRNANVTGFGTTYAIAVLFFISKGKYPIYDKYACKAVKMICSKDYSKLIEPDINSKRFCDEYTQYTTTLNKWMNLLDQNNCLQYRVLDRALWVYVNIDKCTLNSKYN